MASPPTKVVGRSIEHSENSAGSPSARHIELRTHLSIDPVPFSTSTRTGAETAAFSSSPLMDQEQQPISAPLRIIGEGTCGTVFELPGTAFAYKKGPTEGLWNDFRLTNRVHNSIQKALPLMRQQFPNLAIPRTPLCHSFITTDADSFWTEQFINRLPPEHRQKQAIFKVDRIFPLPQPSRQILIEQYFDQDKAAQTAAKANPDNQDCLVRIYLGERETEDQRQKKDSYDSLRNFPMRLNMLEEIDYDIKALANEMAAGLAILHWQAEVNGMDTEFVLGSSHGVVDGRLGRSGFEDMDSKPHHIPETDISHHRHRRLYLWMLDFDKAEPIKPTASEVKTKLVPAFLGNDPYFPLPGEEELWGWFGEMYLAVSDVILRAKHGKDNKAILGLPKLFLKEVRKMWEENTRDWDAEERIVFG